MVYAEVGGVLTEIVADVTDRGDAESDRIALRMHRIPMKVPLQITLTLGNRERVVRPGKMTHADIFVTGGA